MITYLIGDPAIVQLRLSISHWWPCKSHWIPFTSHWRPFTSHRRPFTSHRRPFTSHWWPFTSHRRPFTSTRRPFISYWRPGPTYLLRVPQYLNGDSPVSISHWRPNSYLNVDAQVSGSIYFLYIYNNIYIDMSITEIGKKKHRLSFAWDCAHLGLWWYVCILIKCPCILFQFY